MRPPPQLPSAAVLRGVQLGQFIGAAVTDGGAFGPGNRHHDGGAPRVFGMGHRAVVKGVARSDVLAAQADAAAASLKEAL